MGKTGSSLQRLQGSSQMKGLLCLKSPLKKLKIPFFYAPSLTLLQRYGLRFVLFKQTPFVNHEIGGLDLLFGSPWEYDRALNYLKRDGFVVYLSEKNEPYKTMVVKYDKTNDFLLVLHLQRKVAWCGLEALSAKEVLAHAKTYKGYSGLLLPCYEDILLIHAGHILFENYTVQPYEHHIFNKLKKRKLDQVYIQRQLEAYGWNTSFEKFMHLATQEHAVPFSLPVSLVAMNTLRKMLLRNPFIHFFLLAKQSIQYVTKRISLKKRGLLIVFEGVNGSGKSTLTQAVFEKYQALEDKLTLPHHTYYFGWKPFFPLTKFISWVLSSLRKDQGIQGIYQEALEEETHQTVPRFSLKNELMFSYLFFDYLLRYYFHIYPWLRKRSLVVCDRSFYHLYGQYPYTPSSAVMKHLVKLFPRPDSLFLLDVDLKTLAKRRKTIPPQQLKNQLIRYQHLIRLVGALPLKNAKRIDTIVRRVVVHTWRKRFEHLQY